MFGFPLFLERGLKLRLGPKQSAYAVKSEQNGGALPIELNAKPFLR